MADLIDRDRLLEYLHGEPVGIMLCEKYNLDGFIKGLKPAEQPEPCEDAVSRKAINDALDEQLDYLSRLDVRDNPHVEFKWYGINWSKNTIADLPSVTPKQGSGYWILGAQYRLNGIWAKCSKCNDWSFGGGDYCRNCGIKMIPKPFNPDAK